MLFADTRFASLSVEAKGKGKGILAGSSARADATQATSRRVPD